MKDSKFFITQLNKIQENSEADMNNEQRNLVEIPSEVSQTQTDSPGNPVNSSARRRLLIEGVLKGSAAIAATTPIRSLASTSSITANGKICSISGVQSAAHSQKSNLPTCGGLSPGYYKMLSHWPNYNGSASPPVATNTVNGKSFTQNTPFNTVFGSGPSESLIFILLNNSNTAEFHYIAALLNSIKPPSGYVFPYSGIEVINFYGSPQKSDALSFFKNYMETI